MKKLLAFFLVFSIIINAEDTEYPIELTCESGTWIHQISITGKNKGWIQKISGPKDHITNVKEGEKLYLKNIIITESMIELKIGFGPVKNWSINRYSGGVRIGTFRDGVRGRCFKGFREYKEKKI